jgi:hypothetical protein
MRATYKVVLRHRVTVFASKVNCICNPTSSVPAAGSVNAYVCCHDDLESLSSSLRDPVVFILFSHNHGWLIAYHFQEIVFIQANVETNVKAKGRAKQKSNPR